ncbi:MAG: hypothetical protein DMF37_10065 [Verrucomicrobia bacterium]|nr:MAG: hypothetical protein DMF37_10065 [Verrucomicrobiota bacterium]
MSVLFDLSALVIVFLAIGEATHNFYPSFLGALCYAVLPMQVIYAHFMRTHILSNLLCALVIWLSLKLRQSQRWQLLLSVGLISGLGAATHYPVGLIVAIPCLYLLFNGGDNFLNWRIRFVIGLFLGHPMLFLNPSSVIKAITDETLKYASLHQFSASQLLNLAVVWKYVTYVIPFATYPLLWVVFYCAIVYLLFRRSFYSVSVPILIFSLLYLYLMGKGYLGPVFARVTMVLFPGFCVLVGIACSDVQLRLKNNRALVVVLTGALIFVIGPSVVFDIAYGRAMQKKDARQLVRRDLQKLIGEAPATIGVARFHLYFYTVMPAAKPLISEKVAVQLQDSGQDADFFLVGFASQIERAKVNETIEQVEAQGKFKFEKTYSVPVKIFGREFSLVRFPQDMTYPFPTILLFRATTSA